MLCLNCAALTSSLLESELFGHERGAFTSAVDSRPGRFREASGGTLFLDEIGDMPPELQAKLLRVLQSGEVMSVGGRKADAVDVRILAATHRDLDEAVRTGAFREDLLYRLRVIPIHIPPLRARRDDIPVLAEHFMTRYSTELVGEHRFLSEAATDALSDHHWQGNVRELENAIKRAIVLSSTSLLTPEDFVFLDAEAAGGPHKSSFEQALRSVIEDALDEPGTDDLYRGLLERVERPLLELVLAHTSGNQIRAAALLGINRNTLRKKITDLAIQLPGRNPS